MIARSHHFTLSILLTFGLLVALCLTPSAAAAQKWVPPKKTTTYSVTIHIDGRTVVAPFVSTETVTAEILANPWEHGRSERLDRFSHTQLRPDRQHRAAPGCELMTTRPLARPRLPSPNRARTSTSCGVRASTRSCPRC